MVPTQHTHIKCAHPLTQQSQFWVVMLIMTITHVFTVALCEITSQDTFQVLTNVELLK